MQQYYYRLYNKKWVSCSTQAIWAGPCMARLWPAYSTGHFLSTWYFQMARSSCISQIAAYAWPQ